MRRASCFDEVGEVWSGGAGARAAPMGAVRANSQEALRDERYGHGRELLREERLLGVACANSSGERDRKLLHRHKMGVMVFGILCAFTLRRRCGRSCEHVFEGWVSTSYLDRPAEAGCRGEPAVNG